MAYRYSASGTLVFSDRNVDTACAILSSKHVTHERHGNSVSIKHDERSATPSGFKAEAAFEDLAPYVDEPQALTVFNELVGEYELGFIGGRTRTDEAMHVWANGEKVPTPDELVAELKARGLAARSIKLKGSRKSGRRARVFEVQPGSGGPGVRVTIKRRFWDSFDLLSVPEIYQPLCRKYHMSADALREVLRNATFGLEVRRPALGNASSDLIFDTLLEVIEELTDGIRTDIG
ncbi:MAG: hypothetical protein AB7N76_18945 [Planctomycetota bacterium]